MGGSSTADTRVSPKEALLHLHMRLFVAKEKKMIVQQ